MLSYKDHSEIRKLEKLIDENAGERSILSVLKDLRYKKIGKKVLNKLLKHFKESDYNWIKEKYRMEIADNWFTNNYETFMDFFSRKLTDKKIEEIESNIKMYR